MPGANGDTRRRVLAAAMVAFSQRGYEATSLDALAAELGLRKQTILYYFSSKEALLDAVIDEAGRHLVGALEGALTSAGPGLQRVDSVVRSVFLVAAHHPELLGLLREVSRLGPPPATRLRARLDPFIERATSFLEAEMAAGTVRRQDARLLLLAAYSTVIGVATEVEVLRALGVEPTPRSLVRRRAELLGFLRSALGVGPLAGGAPGVGPLADGAPGVGPLAGGPPGVGPLGGGAPGGWAASGDGGGPQSLDRAAKPAPGR